MSRYNNRQKIVNSNEMYDKLFEDRGVKHITQFNMVPLEYPNEESLLNITTIDYTWRQGDKFWKLASTQYGDPRMWWVIAQYNKKPTENHVKLGETIKIPVDLGVILGALSV